MIIGKETKDNLEIMSTVFEFCLALESDATSVDAEFMQLETHVSWDRLTDWKKTGLGGRACGNVQFCHCCALHASRMHLPNQDRCRNCCPITIPLC
jgi:hypothetical protein